MRLGLVGCGKIGQRHLEAYKTLGDVQPVVWDTDRNLAAGIAIRYGITAAESLEHLLDGCSVDAVDVCVPTPAHLDTTIAALRHDKHVFCEKPLALSADEVRTIQQEARARHRRVRVGYLYRYFPGFVLAKQLLRDGILAPPIHALFRLGGRGSAAEWKHRADRGGGAVLEMLVHMLDLAQWLLGPLDDPLLLISETLHSERRIGGVQVTADAEDYVVVGLKADRTRVLCQADLATPSFMNFVELQSANGCLVTSSLLHFATTLELTQARGPYKAGRQNVVLEGRDAIAAELDSFVRACYGEGPDDDRTLDDSLSVMELVDLIRRSSS